MSFKTILVHLDAGARCAARTDLAIALGGRHGGHLVGLAPTGLPDVLATMSGAVPDGVEFIALSARFLRERAQGLASAFDAQVRAAGTLLHEARVAVGDPLDSVVRQALCADLVVVGQTDRSASPDGVAWDFPQQVVLQGGCPVLVVPYAGDFSAVGTRVMVAWKGTREAARALRDALPVLKTAERVVVVEVADEPVPQGADVGLREVQAWLARHGIAAEIRVDAGAADAGDVLLSRAADLGSDLIVMGAYGHSRMREWVLGGVTRHLLDHMTVPTLLSH